MVTTLGISSSVEIVLIVAGFWLEITTTWVVEFKGMGFCIFYVYQGSAIANDGSP